MRRMYVCMSEIGNNHEEVTVTGFFLNVNVLNVDARILLCEYR